jgi:processive 1,2-diacylglycerol beta-glucosyltransferase
MRKPLPGKAEARRALGIDPDRFTVMLSLGGEGIGRLFSYVDHYARHGSSAQLLVLTGRNAGLLARLDSYLEGRPGAARLVKAYGFLPDLITHLAAADVAAGKCGASFVSELVAARRPLLVMQLGAPNEAANRTYLAQRGFAWDVPRPVDFTELVESFASGDERFSRAVARMEGEASRCEGADQIADAAAALLARPPTALRA